MTIHNIKVNQIYKVSNSNKASQILVGVFVPLRYQGKKVKILKLSVTSDYKHKCVKAECINPPDVSDINTWDFPIATLIKI